MRKNKIDHDYKQAYLNQEITLTDYVYAQAANIAYIPYLDPDEIEFNLAQEMVQDQEFSVSNWA